LYPRAFIACSGVSMRQTLRCRPDLAERYRHAFQLYLGASAGRLSMGMRSRLALLLVLPRRAELLLLDEPTEGLDPSMVEVTLQALVSLVAEEGTTVFFSSHQLASVEQIADHVCIIDQRDGRTLSLPAIPNVDEIVARAGASSVRSVDVQPVTLKDIFLESSKGAPS